MSCCLAPALPAFQVECERNRECRMRSPVPVQSNAKFDCIDRDLPGQTPMVLQACKDRAKAKDPSGQVVAIGHRIPEAHMCLPEAWQHDLGHGHKCPHAPCNTDWLLTNSCIRILRAVLSKLDRPARRARVQRHRCLAVGSPNGCNA